MRLTQWFQVAVSNFRSGRFPRYIELSCLPQLSCPYNKDTDVAIEGVIVKIKLNSGKGLSHSHPGTWQVPKTYKSYYFFIMF